MNEDICTINDLVAVVPRYDRWSVDKDGNLGDFISDGCLDADTPDIEEYQCQCCGEYFTPDKRYSAPALDYAWKLAVAHLPSVAAPTVVEVA